MPTGARRVRLILLVAGVATLVIWISGQPRLWPAVSGSERSAERILRHLGSPAGAAGPHDLHHYHRDGLQSEEASASYTLDASAPAILDHYRRACRRLGLTSPPSPQTQSYYAAALCDGDAIVTVEPRCATRYCTLYVQVIR